MRYRDEIITTSIIIILILFLRMINVFQFESGFVNSFIMLLTIIIFSFIVTKIQHNIDKNYRNQKKFYQNLDILKYFSAILIIILHLRPFHNFSRELDLAFNNIITRICVPVFFLITGYFIAKKETNNTNYIDTYIKKTIPLYLTWSFIYIIFILCIIIPLIPSFLYFADSINIPIPLFIIGIIILLPIVLIIAILYTGVFYHLWYFPAVIFSLMVLRRWKKNHKIKHLLIISFILLLFGATETYYGILPLSVKELLSFYYNIFFTTRNFLFFGLFYIVFGYFIGTKENLYSRNCLIKLIFTFSLLIFEAILLHDTDRLNSNILLSCVPLTYYLFISTIYISNHLKIKFPFGTLSKYYYLIHPMIIFIISFKFKDIYNQPYLNIAIILIFTHIISELIIRLKNIKNNT